MSWQASAWALNQTTGNAISKLVLIAMADGADQNGVVASSFEAWTAYACTVAETDDAHVTTALRALCDAGLVAACKVDGGFFGIGWRLALPDGQASRP